MWGLTGMVTFLFAFPPLFSLILSLFYGNEILFLMDAAVYSGILGFTWASYLASDFGTKKLGQYVEIVDDQQEEEHGSK